MPGFRFKAIDPSDYANEYDAVIGSTGFEARARHIPLMLKRKSQRLLAWGFHDRHEHDWGRNQSLLEKESFDTTPLDDDGHFQRMGTFLSQLQVPKIKLAIDISSMTRTRIADWAFGVSNLIAAKEVIVDFYYSVARFSPPS